MAVSDDLRRLAAEAVVYLTRVTGGPEGGLGGATEVFRGRLRQALDGNWVFNASLGQNGVVGFNLGPVTAHGKGALISNKADRSAQNEFRIKFNRRAVIMNS